VSSLVHAALTVRRTARATFGYLAAAAFAILDLLGVFRVGYEELGLEHGVVTAAWIAVFASRATARFKQEESGRVRTSLDLELGLLLLTAAHAVVQVGGGLTSDLYPLVYILVAFIASFGERPVGSILVLFAVFLEAGLWFITEDRREIEPFAVHAAFIVFFGLLNLVFTRVEIARVRKRSRRELDLEREKVRDDARLFRLVSAPTSSGAHDEERLLRSSMEQVHAQLFHLLDMLKKTMELHTCILFFVDESGERLSIVEMATDSDDIADGPFKVGGGAVGAVASRGVIMNLENLRLGYKGLCYYRGPAEVRAFVGVPVVDDGKLRGVLACDRRDERAFSGRDEQVLEATVKQILRTVENERVFVQLERSKREQTVLYGASQMLGAALTEDEVIDAGLSAAAEIAPYDFAAVTLYDPESKRHSVRRAVGEGAESFAKLTFRDNTSLTAMAVKNRHYLPYKGEFDPRQQVVFTKRKNLKGMSSLLIMPLVVRENAIGTIAFAAHRRDAFGSGVRPTLSVLANHVAVALSNAAAVRRLEEMATTDGLTGCLNKRAFHEELESKIRSAERFDRKLSLLVTDIDHFKSVNDTYGHATGDVVIKELGEILRRMKRETDVVSRFGGEEFCILCEETDTEGAVLLAERVREELEATVFQTELGRLKVTASIGVATFPHDAMDERGLFEASDRALYAAKHGGRNQVRTVDDV
jgi:diguanylate cyclase (GGDEF)-like protein